MKEKIFGNCDMFVYAIHRENVWTTNYNVVVCSSEKHAKQMVEEYNQKFNEWNEMRKSYHSNYNYRYDYDNPQPPKYRIEKLKVLQRHYL